MSELRPSSLPKLAACPCYESDQEAGPAAARGTQLDGCFRASLAGQPWPHEITDTDDIEAVKWAVETVKAMAGGSPIIADEAQLHVDIPGLPNGGTADVLCPERFWSGDLKTGEVRNYLQQMAAYALGFMEQQFCDEWTCHLFFADERQLVRHHFTRAEAAGIVRKLVASVKDDQRQPTPCEYCGWCAARTRCPARIEQVAWAMGVPPDGVNPDAIAEDPEKLADYLQRLKAVGDAVEDFIERGKSHAMKLILAGAKLAGITRVNGKTSKSVGHDAIGRNIDRLGFGPVLAAYGNLSEAKARELWKKCPDLPFPEDAVETKHGAAYLRISPKR